MLAEPENDEINKQIIILSSLSQSQLQFASSHLYVETLSGLVLYTMLITEYPPQVEKTDGESVEGVSEPGPSVDTADSELIHRASPGRCEDGEKVPSAAANKAETAEMEEKESQSSVSDEEVTKVKMNEDHKSNKDHASQTKDISVDTNMDKMSDHSQEKTDTAARADTDIDTRQENVSQVCTLRVSTADDLDEMMDIGTVDQVEQEAHMKEEEGNRSMDVDGGCSPAIPSPGNLFIDVKTGRGPVTACKVVPTDLNTPESQYELQKYRSGTLCPNSHALRRLLQSLFSC